MARLTSQDIVTKEPSRARDSHRLMKVLRMCFAWSGAECPAQLGGVGLMPVECYIIKASNEINRLIHLLGRTRFGCCHMYPNKEL